jgi:hypothetical protein
LRYLHGFKPVRKDDDDDADDAEGCEGRVMHGRGWIEGARAEKVTRIRGGGLGWVLMGFDGSGCWGV